MGSNGLAEALHAGRSLDDGRSLRPQYLAGHPWPHLLEDGVIPADLAATAAAEVTALPRSAFTWQHTRRIQKGSLSDVEAMGPASGP